MRSFFARCARFAALLPALALVSCGDDVSPPPEPEPDHVTRETTNTASGSIGPAGGTLQTTADDGTVYTLTIPVDAIAIGSTITMTPITAIDGYPLAGGVVGGVELKPSGTVFAAPVTLEIATTKTPDAGSVPMAILFSGNGTSFEPSFAGSGAGRFTVPMTHFSGGTVGFATAQELARLILVQGAPCLAAAVGVADLPTLFATYRSCFASDVLPAIEQASNDVQLAAAIGQFIMWKDETRLVLGSSLFATFDDVAATAQAHAAIAPKLREAIARNNQRCGDQQSLASLANVLFWQKQAARFGFDSVANRLDRETILRDLCARPVVDTIVIPSNLQVGFPHSLDIQFGLLFNGQAESQGAPFAVQLTGDGIEIQQPIGFTNSQGQYTTVIAATRGGVLFVNVTACLVSPGTTTATDVCVRGVGSSSGDDLTGTWTGSVTMSGPSGTTVVPVCAIISQNQNAISGTIHIAGGTARLLATLSGSQLLGVSLEGFFGVRCGCDAEIIVCTTTGRGIVDASTLTINAVYEDACNDAALAYSLTRGGSCPP